MSSSEKKEGSVIAPAPSHQKSLWWIVLGFFAFSTAANLVLRRFISSQRLVDEVAVFSALLVLYLVIRGFAEVDVSFVTDLIVGSGLYLTQLLLSLVMPRSLAIALAVVIFVIGRELVLKRFQSGRADNRTGTPGKSLASILFQALILGALAFVICELLLRLWNIWKSS